MVSQSNKDDLKRQGDDMADQSTEMVKSGTDSAKNATNGVLDSAKQSLDNTVPPQDRQQIWESAKKSPLAYSLLLVEAIFAFIPVMTFGSYSVLVTGTCLTMAVVASLALISLGLMFLVPVLMVLVPMAAFTWMFILSTATFWSWVYERFYVESTLQKRISNFADQFVESTREIENNAAKEFQGYKTRAKEQGQDLQRIAEGAYDDARDATRGATKDVENGVRSNGLIGDILHDDGVLGGLAAKTDRVADRVSGNFQNGAKNVQNQAEELTNGESPGSIASRAGDKIQEGADAIGNKMQTGMDKSKEGGNKVKEEGKKATKA